MEQNNTNDLEKILNNTVGGIAQNSATEETCQSVLRETENKQENERNTVCDNNEAGDYKTKGKPKKEKKKSFLGKVATTFVLGAAFGLIAGVAFFGMNAYMEDSFPFTNKTNTGTNISVDLGPTTLVQAPEGDVVNTSISTVAQNVMPSVVSITNLTVQEVESLFNGTQKYEYESSGSGIIIGKNDAELLLVTNNHVIERNKTLTVMFVDGSKVNATVKGTNSNIDIAVIAVKLSDMSENTLKRIKVATLGNSDDLVVGEPTIAIGNALGYGQSVTSGIVSAIGRKMNSLDTKLIQTDAAINPGNSGGALLNIRGEVIGINTAKVSGDTVEGMGYAIPISEVKEIIEEMMNKETKEKVPEEKRGKIGILCVTVDENAMVYFNMPRGAYINKVTPSGAADKAGITKGSIITKFDGTSVASSNAVVDMLAYYEVGETVELEIAVPTSTGEYETKTIEVTLQAATE